ncbi:TAXI family TRAP transporter solute-binding subunit [Thauera aromatica]|uniref:TRAP transporter, solute receptor n=1 Tax=Thauera aromatica K172 TaxID=44139 RepID=A0A2R4BNI8_THAAR|nr:TAXI family TRAP transporter solute-binding subunit [Thauera aromatica]AVR88743.1 TRAP transporter, solute receptor [Thauera aromatica K172]MCK2096098.1 TAXI family TRAP transporter solute-binding subunit [Thauera aromatica]
MKSLIRKCALGTLFVAVTSAASAATFVNVLTGGTSGVYYPLGVTLSQVYGEAIPDSKVQVQATKASAENLNLLQAGRGEIGFSLADSVSDAWKGNAEAGFTKPLDKLRAVASVYPNYIQIVALADANIQSLADLKGKRISVGAPRSGTEINARAILKAAGLTYADFAKVEYLPFGESVELMKNRQIDVTLQSAGLGVAALRDLSAAVKVNFVPIPAEVVAKVGDAAYQSAKVPANTYEGQTADVATVAINNLLITHEKVPAEVVYQMTKGIFDNLERLGNSHSAARQIKLEKAIEGLPVPLHPGAEKYYREQGLIK